MVLLCKAMGLAGVGGREGVCGRQRGGGDSSRTQPRSLDLSVYQLVLADYSTCGFRYLGVA